MMELRRGLLMKKVGSILPSAYQQVEYIKTPGPWLNSGNTYKSFICTDIAYTDITKIVCKYKVITCYNGVSLWYPIYISSHASGSTTSVAPFATLSSMNGFQSASPLRQKPYEGTIDTYTVTMLQSMQSNRYLKIGGWTDTSWTAEGAYYFIDVYNGDDKVASFIPCYRKSDNKAGMYEVINGNFFSSDGEFDFIAGQNVN